MIEDFNLLVHNQNNIFLIINSKILLEMHYIGYCCKKKKCYIINNLKISVA